MIKHNHFIISELTLDSTGQNQPQLPMVWWFDSFPFMFCFLGGQRWVEHQGVWHHVGETQHLRPGHQLPHGASWWGAAATGSVSSSQPRHDGVLCGWVRGSFLKLGQSCSGNGPITASEGQWPVPRFIFVLCESLYSVSMYESLGIHLSTYTAMQ